MSDLKPLRESSRDDFANELLDSAFLDEPPRHALRRTALWLGVGEAAATTLVAGSALGAAPEAMAAGALATKAANGGSAAVVAVLKWLGVGAVVGAVTAGGFEYATHSAARPPTPADTAHAPLPADRSKAARNAARPTPAEERKVSDPSAAPTNVANLERVPAGKPRAVAATARDVERAPALDLEIGQLDRARAALAGGKPESALAELDAYERRRKTLVLEREATVLRIDALLGQGERAAAAALARAYIAAHPDDPHARRLRALVEPQTAP